MDRALSYRGVQRSEGPQVLVNATISWEGGSTELDPTIPQNSQSAPRGAQGCPRRHRPERGAAPRSFFPVLPPQTTSRSRSALSTAEGAWPHSSLHPHPSLPSFPPSPCRPCSSTRANPGSSAARADAPCPYVGGGGGQQPSLHPPPPPSSPPPSFPHPSPPLVSHARGRELDAPCLRLRRAG